MAGGNPAIERQNRDFYPTPPEVTRALLTVEKFVGIIHEPCCGDGRMAEILKETGCKVLASDIEPIGYGITRDFFSIKKPVAHNIVTNPPFNLAREFIEHALINLKPNKMALVLKATYWHAKNRKELFDRFPPSAIYPLLWRPDFMELGRPTMEIMWCVWDKSHHEATRYLPLNKPLANRA